MPRPTVAKPKPSAAPAVAEARSLPTGWMCALIFLLVLVAFFPALQGGFIWDDAGHVTRADLRSLTGLVRIWFEPGATQQYYPALHTAFWLEHLVVGESAFAYHLINILLHATGACLVGVLLRRLAVPGAWVAALCFALHPVAVESVAWIAEQKNTLSTVLYLYAALAWLRFDETRRRPAYVRASILFAFAVLTKTVAASLPAALLVVTWWRRGKIDWRNDVRPLLPWFGFAAVASVVTITFERSLIGAAGADFALGPLERLLLAGRVIWFYAAKLAWPANLMFVYPRWTITATDVTGYLAIAGLGALVAFLWRRRREGRGPLAAVLFFAGSLFPALGFVNVFPFIFSFVADHFQYLASIGLFTLLGAAISIALGRLVAWQRHALVAALLVTLGTLTWAQARMYQDSSTLWEETLRRNPEAWLAHHNLGNLLVDAGRAVDAIPHFETTLRLHPNYAEGESNLADALTRSGRPADAIPHVEKALRLQPKFAEAQSNFGVALMALGKPDEALAHFREAVKLKPDYATAHFNLGLALASSDRPAEAISEFQAVIRLQPDYAEAELDWAIALTLTNRFAEARPHFERALQLEPANPDAQNKFGRALATNGRWDDAITHYRMALEVNPGFAEAHYNLALALRQTGRIEEATAHLNEARRLGWR